MAACERLKQLKGSKNKYEVEEEAPVYDYVDDDQYAEMVIRRQKEDWIVDDGLGGGYVEDGREVFDDEADDGEDQELYEDRSKKKKIRIKRAREEDPPEEEETVKSHSLVAMFKSMADANAKRKKIGRDAPATTATADDADLLENIIADYAAEPGPSASTSSSYSSSHIRPNKLKKKQLPIAGHGSPLAPKPLPRKHAAAVKAQQDFSDVLLTTEAADDEVDSFQDDDLMDKLTEKTLTAAAAPVVTAVDTAKPKALTLDTEWSADGEQNADVAQSFVVAIPAELDQELPFTTDAQGDRLLKFYWLDAHESLTQPGTVYLFGKVHMKSLDKFVSCCVAVKGIERRVFLLPREHLKSDPSTKVTLDDVFAEFGVKSKELRIKTYKSKHVTRKYAFERPGVPAESEYLELLLPPQVQLPDTFSGDTFECAFGANQSFLERLIIDRKLRGPGWITLKNPGLAPAPVSWTKVELEVSHVNRVSYDPDDVTPAPPVTLMSIALQTYVNPSTRLNEVVAVSVLVDRAFNLESGTSHNAKLQKSRQKFDTHFCVLTKPSPSSGIIFPYDLNIKNVSSQYKGTTVDIKTTERELLNYLMAKWHQIDADIILGHDIMAFDLEVLLNRMAHYKVATWSKLGRLRRTGPASFKNKRERAAATAGRLICDLKISAKELIRAKSFDLAELALQVVKEQRPPEVGDVGTFFSSRQGIFELINRTMKTNELALRCVLELAALPLALQITKIAGNLMSRTLCGGRSERNEFLLLHAFYEQNYLCPDKNFKLKDKKAIHVQEAADDDEQVAEQVAGGKKKAAYTGGLVLEPKVGFYNDFVLVLDFNSLYPSIVREFNICFTTVDHRAATDDQLPPLPDSDAPPGILPAEISKLVEKRKVVKKQLAQPQLTPELRAQYDIKQKALKLTANSMYGCLGFAASRFYARPLAALITSKGRDILQATKLMVEKAGYDVIYGDTDSIMIDTKCKDYDQAHRIVQIVQSR